MTDVYPSWRPWNETEQDLLAEQSAAKEVEQAFDCTITKLSEGLYGIDWALSRDGFVKAFGEFKRRNTSIKKYETLILSASKFRQGFTLGSFYKVPFIVFIQWDEGLYFCKCDETSIVGLYIAGNARGQNGDIEPCVKISTDSFKPVNK